MNGKCVYNTLAEESRKKHKESTSPTYTIHTQEQEQARSKILHVYRQTLAPLLKNVSTIHVHDSSIFLPIIAPALPECSALTRTHTQDHKYLCAINQCIRCIRGLGNKLKKLVLWSLRTTAH